MDTRTAQALIRFGLGRRGSEPVPDDPAAWLRAQLATADPGPSGPSVADGFAALKQDRDDPPPQGTPRRGGILFRGEVAALIDQALTTATPFRERLVRFWANHFTVSIRAGVVAVVAGDFVRSAIRPHVTGRFSDMLLAVMRHPAMLLYLDNAGSIGPDSPFGLRTGRGLNENLARECLELHTVTPASGYSQADVTAFAKILTGWSVGRLDEQAGFRFRPAIHEPGAITVMGRSFAPGEQGGEDALAFLGTHAATYHHLATKLVAHFVADVPPPDAVRRVEAVLHDTDGDLGQAALAVVALDAAWQPLTKLRGPQDYVLAALRAADLPVDQRPNAQPIMRGLGQPLFGAPFPIGWPDQAADWAGPEPMMRRIDWAYGFAGRAAAMDAEQAGDASLGPLLTAGTRLQIKQAASRRDALTLLLTSPEFQRR
jgi:uncharacterized protein (DUF1800 family)